MEETSEKGYCRKKQEESPTCADCTDYLLCDVIHGFYDKNGYKYKKYKQAIEYIRNHGYNSFLEIANGWTGAYGKYPK